MYDVMQYMCCYNRTSYMYLFITFVLYLIFLLVYVTLNIIDYNCWNYRTSHMHLLILYLICIYSMCQP